MPLTPDASSIHRLPGVAAIPVSEGLTPPAAIPDPEAQQQSIAA